MSNAIVRNLNPRSSSFDALKEIQRSLGISVRGKEDMIELSIAALIAGGHILLEGPPGTGKTSLARGLASAFGGSFRRVQMTSDLLPSDIVGFLRVKPGTQEFEFRRGPIFTNFLLTDELNRSNPKTQGALIEAMAEGTVSVDGVTYPLPDPFFVIATQNPLEFQGVYPLAESQLDRFMLQLPFDFPSKRDELEIYRQGSGSPAPEGQQGRESQAGLDIEALRALKRSVSAIFVENSVLEYCNELVRATRTLTDVSYGVSVRGGLQLIGISRALAFIRGREFVTPREIQDTAVSVLAHRLCFMDGTQETHRRREAIQGLLERIRPPQ